MRPLHNGPHRSCGKPHAIKMPLLQLHILKSCWLTNSTSIRFIPLSLIYFRWILCLYWSTSLWTLPYNGTHHLLHLKILHWFSSPSICSIWHCQEELDSTQHSLNTHAPIAEVTTFHVLCNTQELPHNNYMSCSPSWISIHDHFLSNIIGTPSLKYLSKWLLRVVLHMRTIMPFGSSRITIVIQVALLWHLWLNGRPL